MKNPFPYSHDNKRYYTLNHYFKTKYHTKVAKIPLNAGFTCPNRDGTKAYGGCTFCSEKGSGDSILGFHDDLHAQYQLGLERIHHKWPNALGMAYFQAFTNTYAPTQVLKRLYDPFIEDDDVVGLSIATRPDCLSQSAIRLLAGYAEKKEVWLELGLQSAHDQTMDKLNRAHRTEELWSALERLKGTHIKTCVHLMNGLPNETKEMMVESAKLVGDHGVDAVKIHMLHLIKGTALAKENPPLLSLEEYVDIVVSQLEVLPQEVIIVRLTGDGMAEDLIGPLWTIKKTIVTNEIDKWMVLLDTYQGKARQ